MCVFLLVYESQTVTESVSHARNSVDSVCALTIYTSIICSHVAQLQALSLYLTIMRILPYDSLYSRVYGIFYHMLAVKRVCSGKVFTQNPWRRRL